MTQQTQTFGPGGIGVQIAGDGNTLRIIAAGASLSLDRLQARRRAPTTLIELLLTDARATSLVGREKELADLAAWRDAPGSVAIRCIVGGAGAGKTRLAIEACEAAEACGWDAAFVRSTELARFHATQNLVRWSLPNDVLLVIDYAATSLTVLQAWFALLAPECRNSAQHKLRILLLERQAVPDSGWWAELSRRESLTSAGSADLIGTEVPILLRRLTDRRAVLAETMRLAAPLLDPPCSAQSPPQPGKNPAFDAALASQRIENNPLYLIMAGIHAARYGIIAAFDLTGSALAVETAAIESARLAKFAASRGYSDGTLLTHLVACLTLQNGAPLNALESLVTEEVSAMGMSAPYSAARIADHLLDFLPITESSIDPVRPDLIGESFMLRILCGGRLRGWEQQRAIVLRAYRRSADATIDSLVRTARDLADGNAVHFSVRALQALVDASTKLVELDRIAEFLPQTTLAMREIALDVTLRIVSLVEPLAAKTSNSFGPYLAGKLNDVAIRLSHLGRREDALASAKKAVRLRRALLEARLETSTSGLAASLHNLATFLSDLGHRGEALAAAEQAVGLRRALVAARPDAHTPDLAMSLNNLGNRLSELGRTKDALAPAVEAVRLRCALAAERPEAFNPDLAMSLNNLANRLVALGRPKLALAAAEHAVELCRALAEERPDAFKPQLGLSLATFASALSAVDRREDARNAAEEAVKLHRALAQERPDAFNPILAQSLFGFAYTLEALGRLENAIDVNREALVRLTPYFLRHPAAFIQIIEGCAQDYLRLCELAPIKPDEVLLEPIKTKLQSLRDSETNTPPPKPSET